MEKTLLPDPSPASGRLKAKREGGDRGWYHRLNAHEFEQAPGNGQESLASCIGLQIVRYDLATEKQQYYIILSHFPFGRYLGYFHLFIVIKLSTFVHLFL